MDQDERRRLSLMLGPGRDEVGCDECFELIDQYAERVAAMGDGAEWMPRVAAHLDGCPVCADELETMLALLADRD